MIFYETDFFSFQPRPELEAVDLVITSPPLSVIRDQSSEFFRHLGTFASPSCLLFLDVPMSEKDPSSAARKHRWQFETRFTVENMYPKQTKSYRSQYFYVFGRAMYGMTQADMKAQKNDPSHKSEFNPHVIEFLIRKYAISTVLDPFCGTGTVPRVAAACGFKGFGIDMRKEETVDSQHPSP